METTARIPSHTTSASTSAPAHEALGPLHVLTCVHVVCREQAPIAALAHILTAIDAFVCPRLLQHKSLTDAVTNDNVHLLRRLLAEELAGIELLPHRHEQQHRLFIVGLHIASAAQCAVEQRLPGFRRVLECLWAVNPHAVGTNDVVAEAAAARDLELLEWLRIACPPLDPDLVDSSAAAERAAGNGDMQALEWLLTNRWSHSSTVPVDEAVANSQLPVLRWLEDRAVNITLGSDAIYNAAKLGDLEMLAWLFARPRDESVTYAGDGAARGGHVHVLEWLLANHPTEAQSFEDGYVNAARNGHLDALQWLYEHYSKRYWTESMRAAAAGGHLEIVQFLHPKRDEDDDIEWIADSAAANGHLDVVKFLYDRYHHEHGLIQAAAHSGNLELVKWLHEEHDEFMNNANAINLAIQNGHLDVLEYLVTFRSGYSIVWAIENAARSNRMDIVEWIHAKVSEPNSTVATTAQGLDRWMVSSDDVYSLPIDAAARNGNLEMIQWLETNGYGECSACAMDVAAQRGHLDVAKYLHANRSEGCTTAAVDSAAANGHLAVVQWLHENRTEGCTTNAVDLAVRNGHARVAEFLLQHRTEGCTSAAARDAIEERHDAELIHLLFTHRRELIDLEHVRAHAAEHGAMRAWLRLVAECA